MKSLERAKVNDCGNARPTNDVLVGMLQKPPIQNPYAVCVAATRGKDRLPKQLYMQTDLTLSGITGLTVTVMPCTRASTRLTRPLVDDAMSTMRLVLTAT